MTVTSSIIQFHHHDENGDIGSAEDNACFVNVNIFYKVPEKENSGNSDTSCYVNVDVIYKN